MRIFEKIKMKIVDMVWWFRWRVDPRHRYHVINTMDKWGKLNGVTYGWEEVDQQMMYACFKLFVDYVEKQRPFDIIDFETEEINNALGKEILDLYGWWTITRPKERWDLDAAWSKLPPSSFDENNKWIHRPEARALLDRNKDLDAKDDEMLMRLVKVRRHLWT
jgi:hypothetical protein